MCSALYTQAVRHMHVQMCNRTDKRSTKQRQFVFLEFNLSEHFSLWGIYRSAKNIDPDELTSVRQYEQIERGFIDLFEVLGRKACDHGELVLMVEGTRLGAKPVHDRLIGIVSGTCYSPKVFDITLADIPSAEQRYAEKLHPKTEFVIQRRCCRVSDKYTVMNSKTSSEYIKLLTERSANMYLSVVLTIVTCNVS